QRRPTVAADVERHGLGRGRAHLQLAEVEELAVVLDHAARADAPQDLDRLVDALAAAGVRHPAPLELLRQPADAETEAEPIPGQRGDRADLAGQQHRMTRAELEYGSVEADTPGGRGHRRCGDQRVGPWRIG